MFYKLILFFLIFSKSIFASQIVFDRLLLEIDGRVFSQIDLELYVIIKKVLIENEPSVLLNKESWLKNLSDFETDVYVLTDAVNLKRFYPPQNIILDNFEKIKVILKKNPNLEKEWLRLSPNDGMALDMVANVLQVLEYKKNRDGLKQIFQKDWLAEIKEKYLFREFSDAKDYELIEPKLVESLLIP